LIFRDREARLPHAVAISLWSAAGQLTNDPNLGLHVAAGIRPGVYGALDYAVRTCETLGEGLRRLALYHRFLHDVAETRLRVDRDRAVLSHHLPLPGGASRPVSECVAAGWLLASRQATGLNFIPLEVRFPHSAPDDISEHQRLFGCKLQFGWERTELVFARELLNTPLVKADRSSSACQRTRQGATDSRTDCRSLAHQFQDFAPAPGPGKDELSPNSERGTV